MRNLLVASMLLPIAVCLASAQDQPKREITCTGDSVYEFKAAVAVKPAPDRTNARAIVEAWALLTDKRGDYDKPPVEADTRYKELLMLAMSELEASILTPELAKAQQAFREEAASVPSSYQSSAKATEILEEAAQEDGSVLITTRQRTESRWKGKDDKWEVTAREQNFRYRLVKGADGNWRINTIEQGYPAKGSAKENPELEWSLWRNPVQEIVYEVSEEDAKVTKPSLKTGSPEETALSFAIELRKFNSDVGFKFLVILCRALDAATADWFTQAYKDAVKKAVDERKARPPKPDSIPEIEEVLDLTETSATVRFKLPDNKASDKLVLKLVKQGDSWRISEAGDLRNAGKENEKYEPKRDIYRRW